MKIIEALKSIKDLLVKADDLRTKIANHSAYLSVETPVYVDQKAQVRSWLQAHEDIVKRIEALSLQISLTNATTKVAIKIGDNLVTRRITEWIIRRRTLAKLDQQAWEKLTDRGLKEGMWPASTPGGTPTPVHITRCFDPIERDAKVTQFKGEPGLIDSALEVANATLDLVEYPTT